MPTLTVRNKQFPSGNSLPGGHITPVMAGPDHESASTLAVPDPAHAGQYLTYAFLFWNVSGATNSGITTTEDIDIQIGTGNVTATAWYVLTGGDGQPWTGVYTYSFSEIQDQFLADIPVDSVSPAAAWTAGNQKVETKAAVAPSGVDITAKTYINATEKFDKWVTFSGGSAVGAVLHAAKNSAIWAAIAYYKVPTGVPPYFPGILEAVEEWQGIRDRLLLVADPGPDDLQRMRDLVSRATTLEGMEQVDELTHVVGNLDHMSEVEVRGYLASVKAQMTRLSAAQGMLQKQLKNFGK